LVVHHDPVVAAVGAVVAPVAARGRPAQQPKKGGKKGDGGKSHPPRLASELGERDVAKGRDSWM